MKAEAETERLRDEVWRLKEAATARERAEAASDAKSRFLATMSHEPSAAVASNRGCCTRRKTWDRAGLIAVIGESPVVFPPVIPDECAREIARGLLGIESDILVEVTMAASSSPLCDQETPR